MNFKTTFGFIFIILLSLLFRLIWLDKIPTGMSHDELGFVINAKAFFLTGSDLPGNWSPFSLAPVTGQTPMSELTHLVISPIIGILPLSLFTAKIPFVLANTSLIIILMLITHKLIGKKEAFLVGFVSALNPWSIFFARTAYDVPLAVFFYFLALYILLIAKGWRILIAFIPLFFAFYTYIGTKLIFLPFIFIIVGYAWYFINKKKYLKQYLSLIFLCLSVFAYFLVTFQSQTIGERVSELISPNSPEYASIVNNERRLSVNNPLTPVFSNKYSVFLKDGLEKYLEVFSTEFLFLNGEDRSTFSLHKHGYFYYFDSILILIGLYILLKRHKKVSLLLLSLALIAPLPAVASTSESSFAALRGALLYPLFIILIGVGIHTLIFLKKESKYVITISILLILIYSVQVLNFTNIYFFRYPIYSSDAFLLSSRVVSEYLNHAKNNENEIYIITRSPKGGFRQHLFYNNYLTSESTDEIQNKLKNQDYGLENARFIQCKEATRIPTGSTVLIDKDIDRNAECVGMKVPHEYDSTIPLLSDGGSIYYIYNDRVCNIYELNRYPSNFSITDFDIEDLSREEFCKKFITDINDI